MTVKTVRVCDNRSCGAIIGDEGCECSRLTLTMTSGKAFTAELCKTCSIEIFQNHVWTELITETIIPAEPEPASNPPSEEEPETVFTEPDDDEETTRIPEEYEFDSLDDSILGYIGGKDARPSPRSRTTSASTPTEPSSS